MAHRVVIVGGGFAGVRCALGLRRADVDVTLIDRRNFHLFQPLLYQVATGGLSPGDIAAPLRSVLKGAANARVLLGEVVDVDPEARAVVLEGGLRSPYDTLVVATGVRHAYFGHDAWEHDAPGLKTLEEATEIRARILAAFEQAERESDAERRAALLSFVIVGGGPTGVELAGALGELSHHTMRGEFRSIRPEEARLILVEGGPRILPSYTEAQSGHAVRALARLGVEVRTSTLVTRVDAGGVDVAPAATPAGTSERPAGPERIAAATVLWAAGVAGSPIGRILAERFGAKLDRVGRVVVEPDCSVSGHPEVLVLGDLASFVHTPDGSALPGVAPVAMQMGAHAAVVVRERLRGRPSPPFRYLDKGTMAVIGRNEAVARVGFGLNLHLSGFVAWLAWLFIHIMYLVGYENRLLVLIQWGNHYVTRNRGARLISGGGAGSPGAVAGALPERGHDGGGT